MSNIPWTDMTKSTRLRWFKALLTSVRFHKTESWYQLVPTVWKYATRGWRVEFLNHAVSWSIPDRWTYRGDDGILYQDWASLVPLKKREGPQ